jgi:hypothetical protein
MADPAATAGPPPVIVTGGVPSPDPVQVPSNGICQFNNHDNNPYLIELWTADNLHHPAICVFLPIQGSITLKGDPGNLNATIYYNLLAPGNEGGIAGSTGGTHGIIVGSGSVAEESEAA